MTFSLKYEAGIKLLLPQTHDSIKMGDEAKGDGAIMNRCIQLKLGVGLAQGKYELRWV